ncbi:MAG TPA: efflux RND transporter periplasmic adaptor subunit [Azoarcus sp.]|nr:efflux RND transporter periplasmic adaptor subunit [Azoarcus sp.]
MTFQVTVQEMQSTSVSVINELPGRTRAYRVAEVRPQVNGIVEERLFTEGSEVEAGEQLYQIDDATYQAAHKKAVANLRTAELQAQRYAELSKVDAVSRQAHDDAQAAYLQAQAEVEVTRINLDYTKVLSPISGRIGRSAVTEGALVINGQPDAMATVQQLDPIYVDVTQSSVEIMRLRKALADGLIRQNEEGAARVKLYLEDGSVYQHEGALQFSEVEVSEGTGSVTIRAQFPNPDRELLPGMFVHAQIDSGQVSGVYLLPNQALMLGNEMSTVYVVDDENRIEARRVRNARMVDNQWVITEGLQDGDRVVVEGRQKVRPGAQVEVTVQDVAETAEPKPALAQ